MKDAYATIIESLPQLSALSADLLPTVIHQIEQTGDINQVLLTQAKIAPQTLIKHYASVLNLPIISEDDLALNTPSSALKLKFMQYHQFIALDTVEGAIRLISARPYDDYPQKASALATSSPVELCLASPELIQNMLEKFSSDDASITEISDQIEQSQTIEDDTDIDRLTNLASEAPIVRLVNVLVARAMEVQASDIHIEPFEQRLRIRYRIDGVLHEMEAPPLHSAAAIISRIKIMAKLNIAERRLPQDGRIQMRSQGHQIDLRISTVPSLFGESVVMRILDKEQLNLDFKTLGFGESNTDKFNSLIHRPHGIILVTGPTGSGKTTTLYSALASLNSTDKKIMTVEDPVEYQLDGIMQMQVKPTIGLDFAQALRAIVRQDPDIIMIGEMRDYETASIAIQSALTGHLVFSTLHTNDAGSAITRLLDMGVDDYLITSTIAGIIAQRLVRTLCPACKVSFAPSAELISEFKLNAFGYKDPALYKPTGCDACNESGYKGRTVILEQMELNDSLRKQIIAHADGASLQAQSQSQGMRSMREDGIDKALAGITSLEEVINATQDN